MNYASIKNCDVANGIGIRISLFVSGCRHKCKNCFNQEAWDFAYGEEFTEETMNKIRTLLAPSYIHGLSLLGGEPMEKENQEGLLPVYRMVKNEFPEKTIWCYSGFTFEQLLAMCDILPHTREILSYIDVLVDGKFVEELKDISLRFRGSSNQRIIDVRKSLESNTVVEWKED
ncbi:MAG: anaerobic ribonucleoside-triphosphate reductase activating protein [Erysipelotrichales bacterium]|nr:anaerobic ribonucleoside-triphosphate reductase activating protein [Erysipelotrichales bacterium]MBR3693878.1 anaerobic ribonucleoside-triphosphate reductase activating protein [Erysipelotrichales bacterium]